MNLTTSYQLIAQYHATYNTYWVRYQWWAKYDVQSVVLNKTTVSIEQRITKSSTITYYNSSQTMKCSTGQGTVTKSFTIPTGSATSQTLSTNTLDLNHDADGSYAYTWTCNINNSYDDAGSHTISANISLPTIPRATVPALSLNSVNLDSATTQIITLNRASSSYTHNLYYTVGDTTTQIAPGVGTEYSWAIPASDILALMPTATTATVTVSADTFMGSTQIGTRQSASFTVTTNAIPTITDVSLTGTSFLRYKQYPITYTLTAGQGAKLASGSITSGSFTTQLGFNNLATITSTTNIAIGANTIVISVTDTRGRTASYTLNIADYVPYVLPTLVFKSSTRGNPTNNYSDIIANYSGVIYSDYAQYSLISLVVKSGSTQIGTGSGSLTASGNSYTSQARANGDGSTYYARNSKYTVVATLNVYDGDNNLVDTLTLTTEVNRAMPIVHFGPDFYGTDIPHFDFEGHLIIHGQDKKIIWIDDNGQLHEMTYAQFISLI